MGFIEWIQEMMNNGTIPSLGVIITFATTVGLEIAKNKLVKKLSNSEASNEKLSKKIIELEEANKVNTELNNNTNAVVSALIDMLHVAYSSSKLGVETKIQLQKIYDSCPDAIADVPKLIELIGKEPTVEQVEAVVETETKSYADIIADKYKEV